MNALRRLSFAVSFTVSLILSMSPLLVAPVAAAPPEANQEATTESAGLSSDPGTAAVDPLTVETPQVPQTENESAADAALRDSGNDGDGSVRLRGLEAPVQLEQPDARGADQPPLESKPPAKQQDVERDPGDGPVRKRQEPAKKRNVDREQPDIRVWPMPRGSYTFTQHFGCVPQLGNLYFPGEGCPASAPVIHTGVDLAAPEGTPFYAAASGWVTLADYDRPTADANTRIIIQHDGRNEGYATDYLHWIASYVDEGDYVHAGDPIGEVGNVGFSTGPHLHFSVTDLDTGEFIDPLGWLPDEPGLEGYVSDMPRAQLRLPAGTTAGQPESADPAPHSPPVKENVPKSPSEDGKRGEGTHGKHHGKARDGSSAHDGKRSGKKRSRGDAASETDADESTSDAKNGRDHSRERARTRERNKDGSQSEEAASGDDGESRNRRDDSSKEDRRANRDASKSKDGDGGSKEEPKKDHSGRDAQDTGGDNPNGHDQQSGRDERGADRHDPDQGEPESGSHQDNHERRRKS
jgi:murein DD-endopeptidase MepM/ murein hydrolase activator NlpD